MVKNVLLAFVFGALAGQGLFAANGNKPKPSPSKIWTAARYGLEVTASCCDVCAIPCELCTLCMRCISQQPGTCELGAASLFGLCACTECIACWSGSAPCLNACIPGTCCILCLCDYLHAEGWWIPLCVDPVESCAKSSTQWCQACAKKLRVVARPGVQIMGGDQKDK